jgi:Coenzyme PQQ synthesis protein D (PqqD)
MSHADATSTEDRIPRRSLTARVRNVRGRITVAGADQPLELSDTATFLWRSIDGRRSVRDLADALCAEYDIDRDTAMADVVELVEVLNGAGVVDL